MPGHVRVSGTFRTISQPSVRVSGSWKNAYDSWLRAGGGWWRWFYYGGQLHDGYPDYQTASFNRLSMSEQIGIFGIAVQSDGKILVGGYFTTLNGATRNRLVRLNSNGTEDTAFYTNLGSGFNSNVSPLAVQSDGKILVGGGFTALNGTTRNRLVRLNSNGTEDTAFYSNLGTGFNNSVTTVAVQADGKILVGGGFTTLNGTTRNQLVRLNSNGTVDTAFYSNLGTGFNSGVNTVAVQADGKILVGGNFTTLNGITRNQLVRLNSNGTVDTAFYTNLGSGFNSGVSTVAVQSDGKILVSGGFTTLNGATRNRLVRLNSNGTEDTAFYSNLGTGFNNTVNEVAVQSNGKILVGGYFTTLNGAARNLLVRLNSNGAEDGFFYERTLGGATGGYFLFMGFTVFFPPAIFSLVESDKGIVLGGIMVNFSNTTVNHFCLISKD